jgi:hypothetical protein
MLEREFDPSPVDATVGACGRFAVAVARMGRAPEPDVRSD